MNFLLQNRPTIKNQNPKNNNKKTTTTFLNEDRIFTNSSTTARAIDVDTGAQRKKREYEEPLPSPQKKKMRR